MYPLYCGNISVAKMSPSITHVVDTWLQRSQAQVNNSVHRSDFQKNLSVLESYKKYLKTAVECLWQLVFELGLELLGYLIHMEGMKVVNIIDNVLIGVSYEDDAQHKEADK